MLRGAPPNIDQAKPAGAPASIRLELDADDFAYPTFPFTTLAKLQTTADIQSTYLATVVDQPMSDSPYGPTAIKWTGSNANGSITSKTLLTTPVDVRNGSIRWTFKPIIGVPDYNWSIVLYSSGSPSAPPANYHSGGGSVPLQSYSSGGNTGLGRWQSIGIPVNTNFTAVGSGADLSKVTWAAISVGGSSTSTAIGNIDFVPNPRPKAAVIVRFDNGYGNAYTKGFPLLQAVGAPAFFSLTTGLSLVGQTGFLTSSQISDLIAHGWQLSVKSYSTEDQATVDAMTPAQRNAEYQNCRAVAASFGVRRSSYDSIYYSNVGPTDMTAYPQLSGNFRTLMNFSGGNPGANPPQYFGECFPFGDRYNILTMSLVSDGGSGATLTTYLGYALDQARLNKGVLIISMHNDLANSDALQAFKDMITYVTVTHSDTMEFTTPRKLLAPYNGDTLIG
jgi:hypothetical protein